MLLQKRSNGIFYFRWVYPPALRELTGKRELIKSLHTTSKSQALARAGAYYMAVEDLKRTSQPAEIVLDQADRAELYRIYKEDAPKLFELALGSVKFYKPNSLAEAKAHAVALARNLEVFRTAKSNLAGEFEDGKSIFSITKKRLNKAAKIKLPNLSEFLKRIGFGDLNNMLEDSGFYSASAQVEQNDLEVLNCPPTGEQLERGAIQVVGLVAEMSIGRVGEKLKVWPELYDQYIKDVTTLFHCMANEIYKTLGSDQVELPRVMRPKKIAADFQVNAVAQPLKQDSILFSELYAQFLAYKKSEVNLSQDMQDEYNNYVKAFVFALGDKPINTLTKRQVKEFLLSYEKLPKRTLKAYKTKSIEALWGVAVPEKDRIATRTMLGVKKFLLGVFRFAVNQDYLPISPVVDLDLKIKLEQKRGHFTDPEVRKILYVLDNDKHIMKNEWQKWAVLFGAYTGARAGEVMGLFREDFEQGESGIWSVIVRGTKTKNALRQFPVPPELISKGFLGFVGVGNGRVFPQDKSNKAITSFFPRVLGLSGVPKFNSKKLTRSFHSFRHSVVTKARGSNFDEALVQQIVGHEKTGAGTTDRYTHDFTAEQLLPVVASIKY